MFFGNLTLVRVEDHLPSGGCMPYKRLCSAVVLIIMTVLISGCGGPQNPLQVDSIHLSGVVGKLVNGLWDGFWAILGLIFELFSSKYGVYDTSRNSLLYDLGFVVGLLFFCSLFFGGRKVYYRRRVVR